MATRAALSGLFLELRRRHLALAIRTARGIDGSAPTDVAAGTVETKFGLKICLPNVVDPGASYMLASYCGSAACTRQKQNSPGLAIAYKVHNFTKFPKSAKHEFGSC
jgi:hypothetical protein